MFNGFSQKVLLKVIFTVVMFIGVANASSEENSISPKALFYESIELYKNGKTQAAINKLEQLKKIDPENPNVIANLAQFSGEAGLSKKAAEYYKKLIKLEPDNIQAKTGYALYQSIVFSDENKYGEAVKVIEEVISLAPNQASLLWNLATFSVEVGKHKKALKYWLKLKQLEPKNMHVLSKIIQSYQALNQIKNRDNAIVKMLEMYKSNVDPTYIKKNKFCRQQYKVGDWNIFVFQYFDPGEENLYFYRYSVTDISGRELFWLSLGSYQSTTMISRELGSISASQRAYHLDYYGKNLHATHGMYTRKPAYDDLSKIVREIIMQKSKEL